jgi:hypothetical protein
MKDLIESYLQVWRDKLITDIDKELTPADICSLFRQEVSLFLGAFTSSTCLSACLKEKIIVQMIPFPIIFYHNMRIYILQIFL